MLVQDFTACGLGDIHGPRVNWIPNTERRACGAVPGLLTGGPQWSFIAVFFLELLWKSVSGGLVLSPTLYLTLAEVGLPVNGGFLLFLWKNAVLVVT